MSGTMAERTLDKADAALAHLAFRLARGRDTGGLSPGDMAELRRMDPLGVIPSSMWRLLTADNLREWTGSVPGSTREDSERALAIVACAMVGAGAPGSVPIGKALGTTGYAEQRFVGLLRARGLDDVANTALPAARWCAAKAAGLGFTGGEGHFGGFILAAALRLPDADRRAHAIARDYFANPGKSGDHTGTEP